MEVTRVDDLFVFQPVTYKDNRGFFIELHNQEKYRQYGFFETFVQDNLSHSKKGVIRGLHMQSGDHAQGKLVYCLKGKIKDVFVDCRRESPTYGKVYSFYLSEDDKKHVFAPKGFAHGFSVVSDEALVFYKSTNLYNFSEEITINPLDEKLNIDWSLTKHEYEISQKDKEGISFAEFTEN